LGLGHLYHHPPCQDDTAATNTCTSYQKDAERTKGRFKKRLYPRSAEIPPAKGATWVRDDTARNPEGRYTSSDLEWIPTIILKAFREDAGENVGVSRNTHIEWILDSGLGHRAVARYNHGASKFMRCKDSDRKNATTENAPWGDGQVNAV
jgi:hypothetical protein